MVELHACSSFSFLRGASDPEEIVSRAAELDYEAIGVLDDDGFYGSAKAHRAAKKLGLRALVGTMLPLEQYDLNCLSNGEASDVGKVPVLVRHARGYQALCVALTQYHLRGSQDQRKHDIHAWIQCWQAGDLVALTGANDGRLHHYVRTKQWKKAKGWIESLVRIFGREHVYLEMTRYGARDEYRIEQALIELAERFQIPIVACHAPIYARRSDRLLADAFACLRHYTTLDQAGRLLARHSERYLKSPKQMLELFSDRPEWLQQSHELAASLDFGLENLGYQFPRFREGNVSLNAEQEQAKLKELCLSGVQSRYLRHKQDKGFMSKVRGQLERELQLIARLGFSGYFLIVWNLVRFAQSQGMLCQGRGSAANSVVCYCLGITNADPIASGLLFERFLSETRTSWPDIDVDFPSGEKREAVIQYVYERYSPRGAAMTANVITYRRRSAFREMSKVLGFSEFVADRFSKQTIHQELVSEEQFYEALWRCGVERKHPRIPALLHLFMATLGKPRHLGQHPGGMVISDSPLDQVVPLEPASMQGRVVLQWDKNDCEDLGIVKVDLLGLGMLAAMEDTLRISQARGRPVEISQIPKDDAATYDLMCAADTVGTFQVESRAQMATLPVMQPRNFYDVVVEVALIRPGPIVGDLVHPYLNRRKGREAIDTIHPMFEDVLERTLGVPLFQEQVLRMAMLIADFTGTEAEELRKAMSFDRSHENMQAVTHKLKHAMAERGVEETVQNKVIESIGSFALYGFPESHAISFALIAYASCWLKVHRTAEFYAGLLNHQPMGFYSPSSLIHDARKRGIRVKPVCVKQSWIQTTVVDDHTIRLGLLQVRGLSEATQLRVLEQRSEGEFGSVEDFVLRVRPNKKERRLLASAGALNWLPEVSHRREALWHTEAARVEEDLFHYATRQSQPRHDHADSSKLTSSRAPLQPMKAWERLNADYRTQGVTTGKHPMQLWREECDREGHYYRAHDLYQLPHGQTIYLSGMVICRQRPTTGKGHCFLSMEDETGISNVFIPRPSFETYRLLLTSEPFLLVYGRVQHCEGGSRSLYALAIEPLPQSPSDVRIRSHDYC